jgi:peptidoglycan/LPS O-acetylase OafA/YrhL
MTGRKFDQIDGLRFFAVFGVVCAHWYWSGHELMDIGPFAARGVDLFFVISGFLITLGLIRSKEGTTEVKTSLYKFYIRRFLRIFPIYYLTLLFVYIFWHSQMGNSIGWYLLYLCNFHSIKIQGFGIAGQFWSLSVEEQFYLIWPFIILYTPRRGLFSVMTLSIMLSIAMKIYWCLANVSFWTPYMHPLGCLDVLAMGALLAYFYYFFEDRLKAVLFNPIIASVVFIQMIAFVACHYIGKFGFIYDAGMRTSFGIFSMWLIGRSVFGFMGLTGYILNISAIKYIGKISYAIYLFHDFVPGILLGMKYPENPNLRFLVYGIVTIGMASISWYLFERPILRLKNRFE